MADSKIPMDILVTEILPRLPARSLLRFKCVCKFFKTLISSPGFVQRHLRHSVSSDANRLLLIAGKFSGFHAFHLDSPEFPAVSLRFPSGIGQGSGIFVVVGSCNGLVCIRTPVFSVIIFNPYTGVYKVIKCSNMFSWHINNHGFGFDDINEDYKIVVVATFYSLGDNYGGPGMRREINVYSLKSDSWRLVERTSPQDSVKHYKETGVLIDNHLVHWRNWDSSNGGHGIVCFNLRNDRWVDDVPLPDYHPESGAVHFADILFQTYRNKQNDLIDLGVLDGCLCLLTEKTDTMGVDVWVMKEYGVKESWFKLAGISNTNLNWPLKMCPFAYGKGLRSEILVRLDSQSNFFWYNIREETCRRAKIPGLYTYTEPCICKGSLVGIAGGIPFQIGAWKHRG